MEPYCWLPCAQEPATCPYPKPDQSGPTPFYFLKIHLKFSNLYLGLPNGLLPSGLPTKNLYVRLFSPMLATCPVSLIILDFINRLSFGKVFRSWISALWSLLQSLLGPNILLSTLFSDILSLHSSLKVSDQFSHPQKTADKINVLYTCLVNLWAIKLIV